MAGSWQISLMEFVCRTPSCRMARSFEIAVNFAKAGIFKAHSHSQAILACNLSQQQLQYCDHLINRCVCLLRVTGKRVQGSLFAVTKIRF